MGSETAVGGFWNSSVVSGEERRFQRNFKSEWKNRSGNGKRPGGKRGAEISNVAERKKRSRNQQSQGGKVAAKTEERKMSMKRSPSEIPLNFGVRTVREAIQELDAGQTEGNEQKPSGQNKSNWNENSCASNDNNNNKDSIHGDDNKHNNNKNNKNGDNDNDNGQSDEEEPSLNGNTVSDKS